MRELDGQHARDGDDKGLDVPAEHTSEAGRPRHEAVGDTATRTASTLEYRQRVEDEYAAYNARHAGPQDAEAADGPADTTKKGVERVEQPAEPSAHGDPDNSGKTGPGSPLKAPAGERSDAGPPADEHTDKTERHGHADIGRPREPPAGRDAGDVDTPPGEPEDSWPPPRGDQDRVRKLYAEYLAEMTEADSRRGRDQGSNAVGPKPDSSPEEISGLPPAGDELIEMETSKRSRFHELLREAEKEENLDGLHDAIEEDANTVQSWLSARPPEGHAEQPVPVPLPHFVPWVPEHGTEAGSAASAVMVAGILTIHMARWIDDKLRHGKDDHHVSSG